MLQEPQPLLEEAKAQEFGVTLLVCHNLMLLGFSVFFRRAEMKSRHDEIRKKYGKNENCLF